MTTGKSVQRALRGHLLVDKCLNRLMLSEMCSESAEFAAMIEESETLYTALQNGHISFEAVSSSQTLGQIKEQLKKRKMELRARSKTSQLWLNYQDMVRIARTLIMANRSGSWLNYLKSVHFYVQEMGKLGIKHHDAFRIFQNGYHIIRCSNHFWAGLSSDLVI